MLLVISVLHLVSNLGSIVLLYHGFQSATRRKDQQYLCLSYFGPGMAAGSPGKHSSRYGTNLNWTDTCMPMSVFARQTFPLHTLGTETLQVPKGQYSIVEGHS